MSAQPQPALPVAGQRWDAERYAGHAGFVAELGADVANLLAAGTGERVLDLGCGDGALTARLSDNGAEVVGVDASPELVAAARARGVDAQLGDGHALAFDRQFDAVFSNAALHWMRKPNEVLHGVHRALRPGGRFVAEFGGHGNVAAITTALRASIRLHGGAEPLFAWYFPTVAEYTLLLQRHGFRVDAIGLMPRPTPLPTGMAAWLETFAAPWLANTPVEKHALILATAVEWLAPALRDGSGAWSGDYVRLRLHATAL
ncbi:MAG TPA: class I SAM-dependent methyltransferase [Stenotrophomonas sp.]|jgi:SAM-dependent methyltransferase